MEKHDVEVGLSQDAPPILNFAIEQVGWMILVERPSVKANERLALGAREIDLGRPQLESAVA